MSGDAGSHSVGERVLAGSLWVGSWRWSARLIGLGTTIIVARLLLPDDFGVFATGLIVVSLFDTLIDLGTDHYLIRLESPDRDDYDTAWTLRLILIVAASAVIFLSAAPMASLFEDARLTHVVQVLAVANLIRGFVNIGLTMYRRELQYRRIAAIGITQRVISASTTIALAFALESYWALVLGEVALRIAELLLSYVIHPYRPRFTICRVHQQWDFSKWLMVRNLATFLQANADQMVIAKFFGMEQIGIYSMAARFARMPTSQLTEPMRNPTYSGLAKQQGDPVQLRDSVVRLFGATCVVVLPAVAFCAAVGEELLMLVLGSNWAAAGPLIVPLLLTATCIVICQLAATVLTLIGRVRLVAILGWGAAISIVAVMLFAARYGNLEALAYARAAVAAALMLLYFVTTATVLALTWGRLVGSMYRPAIAGMAAGLVASAISGSTFAPAADIAVGLVAAAMTYLVILYLLWRVARSPESGETLLVRNAAKLLRRRVAERRT